MKFIPEVNNVTPGGTRNLYSFPNGYGASIVCNQYSYGGKNGLFELGVLHNGHLIYDTPITDDVIGYLTTEQVEEYLDRIAALPRKEARSC